MCGQCSVRVACQNGRWCFPVEDCVAPLSLPLSLRRYVQSPFGDHSAFLLQVATYNFPCFLFSTYVSARLVSEHPAQTRLSHFTLLILTVLSSSQSFIYRFSLMPPHIFRHINHHRALNLLVFVQTTDANHLQYLSISHLGLNHCE